MKTSRRAKGIGGGRDSSSAMAGLHLAETFAE
jgi:hypothetical protein